MRLITNALPEQEEWIEILPELVDEDIEPDTVEGIGAEYLWPEKKNITVYSTLETSLENLFSTFFSIIDEVEYVYLDRESASLLNVLTFINVLDRDVREKIYKVEQTVMDYFNEAKFNFHVIALSNRPISDLRPTRGTLVYKRFSGADI